MNPSVAHTENTTQNIAIADISISGNNPRKTFNEKDLNDLTESIRNIGVLQPVLVRPIGDTLELVCGERRLRASKLAGLEIIPVFIKEMSDNDAFEAMIIENLERKDVHPLEESDGFRRMILSGNYTIADIAQKFVKSEAYITQRLKLDDLIDEIKQDFFGELLNISQAVQIAKQTPENQHELHENYKDAYVDGYGSLRELKDYIEDYQLKLSEATFDTEEENIIPGLSSCMNCPKRSGANPLLFSDIENQDTCIDSVCFELKATTVMKRKINAAIDSGEEIYFISGYGTAQDEYIEILSERGFPVLRENRDYRTNPSDGYIEMKGFIVAGWGIGETKPIYIKIEIQDEERETNSDFKPSITPASSPELIEVRDRIEKIEKRAVRDLELDQEKITVKVSENFREIIKSGSDDKIPTDIEFLEDVIFYIALTKVGLYSVRGYLRELSIDCNIYEAKTLEEMKSSLSVLEASDRMRLLIKMIYSEYHSYMPNSLGSNILRACLEMHPDNKIEEILSQQKEVTEKRIGRKDERLADLFKTAKKLQSVSVVQADQTEEALDDSEPNNADGMQDLSDVEPEPIEENFTATATNNDESQIIEATEEAEISESLDQDNSEIIEISEALQFQKVSKKFALSNSYFKNLKNGFPANVLEIAKYLKEHGELPFEYSGQNWPYDSFIEYQKRNKVYHSQYFTPDSTSARASELAIEYLGNENIVLDACCGFGQLTRPLLESGFNVEGFDRNSDLVELYNLIFAGKSTASCLDIDEVKGQYSSIVANPPFEIPVFTKFVEMSLDVLESGGRMVLIVGNQLLDKRKPKALFNALSGFTILHREPMQEKFAHTDWDCEIAVLQKN